MSWVNIWIHLVFSTKNREPLLNKNIREKVFQHIKQNAKEKGIHIDSVKGFSDHCHCLLSLENEQTISKVAQMIKGESSFWINKEKLIDGEFKWQNDYFAVSVSQSHLPVLRKYIWNQEEHHRKTSFTEEMDNFLKKYSVKYSLE